jgi:hypothetical protein
MINPFSESRRIINLTGRIINLKGIIINPFSENGRIINPYA